MVLDHMEGVGVVAGEHRYPVRYWITIFYDQRGIRGKGKLEMPSPEAVRQAGTSTLTLEMESGQSMDVQFTAVGDGPVVSVESRGKVPGY
jgi:hypothetical protein